MLKKFTKKLTTKISNEVHNRVKLLNLESSDRLALISGKILSNQLKSIKSPLISDYEFKIFSQFGDDGIIQHLVSNIKLKNHCFIEFGVEDFAESNCRFLMMNNNYRGFVIDGSAENIQRLKNFDWFWRYDLQCEQSFITKDNINQLIAKSGFEEIAILHIDLDGNDYWIFENLDLSKINPAIIILEYNSVFGDERAISTPYQDNFIRTNYHYYNLCFGASLPALNYLASKRGYSLVGCNSSGNNSYFIRNDLLTNQITKKTVKEAYVESKFRESRDQNNQFTYIRGKDRIEIIKGLDVVNITTNQIEKI
jgi:hypothetical protein